MAEQGSTTERRAKLEACYKQLLDCDDKNEMINLINSALAVPAPVGSAGTLELLGKRYRTQSKNADEVAHKVDQVASSGLPEVWVGKASVGASEVVQAAARAARQMAEALQKGGKALLTLSDAVRDAQKLDGTGRGQLHEALSILGPADGFFDDMVDTDEEEDAIWRAGTAASAGVEKMRSAARSVDDAARAAARDLNKFASEARAGKMHTSGLSAADKLALADTAGVYGPAEMNELLSANDLERSGRYMEKMNARDRAEFDKMLAESKSPQERAYLVKALAAGYDLDAVSDFREKIHGKDPGWLQRHLTPVSTAADSMDDEGRAKDGRNNNTDDQAFGDERWSQDGNTCVPSSTVSARAMVDPVYALELTGGPSGQEDDPDAFRERLGAEQQRVHDEGDGDYDYDFPFSRHPDGMDNDGKTTVVNKEISPHTGASYDFQETKSADARRDVLPDIEKAVADGKPVPIGVEGYKDGDRTGHAMMIIGQEGDKLQVYNPWGTTTWVSEDDFVNGHMGKASDNRMPDAYAVHLPAD
ncbi:peptidoglycan-binding protein [Streptomyces sp. NPDC020742]|uniref:peptidoglycan-binding protein n=1 Tax=unclassified Streptomyces TaxID=2593676 RepID=UPI0034038700